MSPISVKAVSAAYSLRWQTALIATLRTRTEELQHMVLHLEPTVLRDLFEHASHVEADVNTFYVLTRSADHMVVVPIVSNEFVAFHAV